MSRQIKFLVIVLLSVPGVVIAVFCAGQIVASWRALPDMRLHSDMSCLNAVVREELQRYFEQEGRYPDSLGVLTESILEAYYVGNVPEQPEALGWLSRFHYSSTGATYAVTWSVKQHGTLYTHKEYGKDGALAKTELYVDGKLLGKHGETESR